MLNKDYNICINTMLSYISYPFNLLFSYPFFFILTFNISKMFNKNMNFKNVYFLQKKIYFKYNNITL